MTTLPRDLRLLTPALLLGVVLAPLFAHAEFIGEVVGVIDGDSLRVMHEGKAEQIRLLGVDCPEKRQSFGTRAKEYTSELAFGRDVTVYGERRDRYGRLLAEVLVPEGRSLYQEVMKAGEWPGDLEVLQGSKAGRIGTSGTESEKRSVGGTPSGAAWEWGKGMRLTR